MRKLIGVREVCEYLGVSKQTLANWRWREQGPPWFKVGGLVKYDRDELEEWLDEQHEPASTA